MEGVNNTINWTVGCAESLTMQVGDMSFNIHTHVIKNMNFSLLLGHPFQQALLHHFEDLLSGEVEVSVHDPADIAHRVYVPTCPCSGRTPTIKILSVVDSTP